MTTKSITLTEIEEDSTKIDIIGYSEHKAIEILSLASEALKSLQSTQRELKLMQEKTLTFNQWVSEFNAILSSDKQKTTLTKV